MKFLEPMSFLIVVVVSISFCLTFSVPISAQGGHGPTFGLATPTAGEGALSADIMTMSMSLMGELYVMSRTSIRFGLTPDIMLSFSVPFDIYSGPMDLFVPRTRGGTMMGGFGDVEAMALWRFQKTYPGVGKRFESTLLLSALYPTDSERGGVGTGPGVHAAAVTGYTSTEPGVFHWVCFFRYTKT